MKVLVINAGSSSLKFQLIDMQTKEVVAKGNVEKMLLPTADVTDGCQAGISRTVINKEDARGNGSLTEKV